MKVEDKYMLIGKSYSFISAQQIEITPLIIFIERKM